MYRERERGRGIDIDIATNYVRPVRLLRVSMSEGLTQADS